MAISDTATGRTAVRLSAILTRSDRPTMTFTAPSRTNSDNKTTVGVQAVLVKSVKPDPDLNAETVTIVDDRGDVHTLTVRGSEVLYPQYRL